MGRKCLQTPFLKSATLKTGTLVRQNSNLRHLELWITDRSSFKILKHKLSASFMVFGIDVAPVEELLSVRMHADQFQSRQCFEVVHRNVSVISPYSFFKSRDTYLLVPEKFS